MHMQEVNYWGNEIRPEQPTTFIIVQSTNLKQINFLNHKIRNKYSCPFSFLYLPPSPLLSYNLQILKQINLLNHKIRNKQSLIFETTESLVYIQENHQFT